LKLNSDQWCGRQFFGRTLTLRDLQGNFTVSSQDTDAHTDKCPFVLFLWFHAKMTIIAH
jgi:hypothetical protein